MMRKLPVSGLTFTVLTTPIGFLGVVEGDGGLVEVSIHPLLEEAQRRLTAAYPGIRREDGMAAKTQLEEYFQGKRRHFGLPLDCRAVPPFTRQVLGQLAEIPFGETITYGALAARCGRPGAARAVGRAVACNPFAIVLPCHRVVGARGEMTGYSAGEGIATKVWLLDFERNLRVGNAAGGRFSSCPRENS